MTAPAPTAADDIPDGPPQPDARVPVWAILQGAKGHAVGKRDQRRAEGRHAQDAHTGGHNPPGDGQEEGRRHGKPRVPKENAVALTGGVGKRRPEKRGHDRHAGHDGVEQADLGGRDAEFPPERSQVGLEDADGDEIPEVIGGKRPGVRQRALQE